MRNLGTLLIAFGVLNLAYTVLCGYLGNFANMTHLGSVPLSSSGMYSFLMGTLFTGVGTIMRLEL